MFPSHDRSQGRFRYSNTPTEFQNLIDGYKYVDGNDVIYPGKILRLFSETFKTNPIELSFKYGDVWDTRAWNNTGNQNPEWFMKTYGIKDLISGYWYPTPAIPSSDPSLTPIGASRLNEFYAAKTDVDDLPSSNTFIWKDTPAGISISSDDNNRLPSSTRAGNFGGFLLSDFGLGNGSSTQFTWRVSKYAASVGGGDDWYHH